MTKKSFGKSELFRGSLNNGFGAYSISHAGIGNSGYSFGPLQWDLSVRLDARDMFEGILQNSGVAGLTNQVIISIMTKVAGTAQILTPTETGLINQALETQYGVQEINNRYVTELRDMIAHVDTIINTMTEQYNREFLYQNLPHAFLVDYHNQFDLTTNGLFHRYLSGEVINSGNRSARISGLTIGMDDLLNFYFTVDNAQNNVGLNDQIRRINNIASVTMSGGNYTVFEEEEAKGLIRVYQDFLENRRSILTNFNVFEQRFLGSANQYLITAYATGLQDNINGAVIVGEDTTSYIRNNLHVNDDDGLIGTNLNDLILGESGNDDLHAGGGDDVIYGGSGNDRIHGDAGNDWLIGGLDNDTLVGGTGDDTLYGGEGNDTYILNAGDDTDHLIDSGDNTIVINGTPIKHLISDGNGGYVLPGTNIHATNNSSLTITDTTGAGVTAVLDNWQSGDYGIQLIEMPPLNSAMSLTLNGGTNTDGVYSPQDMIEVSGSGVGILANDVGGYSDLPGYSPTQPYSHSYILPRAVDDVNLGAGDDWFYLHDIANNQGITIHGGDGLDGIYAEDPAVSYTDSSGDNVTGATIFGDAGNDGILGSYADDYIDGGQDHDVIYASFGDDIVLGNTGNDLIYGQNGDDVIDGGEGNDHLYGGAGVDEIYGGSGDDVIYGDSDRGHTIQANGMGQHLIVMTDWNGDTATETLVPGVDLYLGYTGVVDAPMITDAASADAGNDILSGGDGKDTIFGGGGNDLIYGGNDADYLAGEAGDDYIEGGDGNDYIWGDIWTEQYNQDVSLIASETSIYNVTFNFTRRLYQDAVDVAGNDTLNGGAGQDVIFAGGGDDILNGGADSDVLYGGKGNDTYVFDANWGNDVIVEEDGIDTIQFGSGIKEIYFVREGDDLGLTDNQNNWIRIKNWFSGNAGSRIEEIRFADGSILDTAQLASAPLSQIGSAANELFVASAAVSNQYVFAANWGSDLVVGQGINDTILFGDGIYASDIKVSRQNNDLTFSDVNGNSILVQGWYADASTGHISEVKFADGTVWSQSDINLAALNQTGTDGNDVLTAFADNSNTLSGGLGNDRLIGANLNDVLDGGAGNDTLSGGGGDDLLIGGTGADTYLIGNELGNTILRETVDSSINTVRFANGALLSHVTSSRTGDDLTLSWNDVAGSATIEGYFNNPEAWQFQSSIGLSIPNDSIVNPPQSNGALLNQELQSYTELVEAELSARVWEPTPVTGTVTVYPAQIGSLVVFQYQDPSIVVDGQAQTFIFYQGSIGSSAFYFSDPMYRGQTNVVTNQTLGTDGHDVIPLTSDIGSTNRYQDVYVTLSSGFLGNGTNSSSYVAQIVNSSYTRPGNLPANVLLSSGSIYQNILRTRVEVGTATYQYSIINAGAGDDVVGSYNPAYSNQTRYNIDGGDGGDILYGGAGGDFLYGNTGDDDLYGYGGDDVLVGGQGNDVLDGGTGADRYIIDFNQQTNDMVYDDGAFTDGPVIDYLIESLGLTRDQAIDALRSPDTSTITQLQVLLQASGDTALAPVTDTVRINANFSDVSLNWVAPDQNGSVGIQIRSLTNPDASVTVLTRGPNDFYGYGIENFEFADQNLTQEQLLTYLPAKPIDLPIVGTPGEDDLFGTDNADIFVGLGESDYIEGGDGDDVYLFNAGDSLGRFGDEIYDYSYSTGQSGTDTLSFGLGIRPEDITASLVIENYSDGETYTALDIEFDDSGDNYLWIDWDYSYPDGTHENSAIEYVQFITSTGSQVFSLADIVNARYSELDAANQQGVYIPLFTPDVIANYDVTATVGLAGGDYAYNYATTGDIYTAPNTSGTNTPPVLNSAMLDQSADQASVFTYTIPANTFTDADGDSLAYTATLGNGNSLPAWLQFDAATRTFSGTPGNNDVGNLTLLVTATDTSGASVTGNFGLMVNNVNDAPVVVTPIDPQNGAEGTAFSLDVATHFSDVDAIHGDQLNYILSSTDGSAMPAWLGIDSATGMVSGTAPVDNHLVGTSGDDVISDTDNGIAATYNLRATATDTSGASASSDFQLNLQGVAGNDLLEGLDGNDTLLSGAGNDTLIGGTGNDALYGGAGNDTYVFNAGDGTDVIYDSNANGDVNTVVFGAGVDPANITLSLGSLLVNYGNGGALHIADFDPNNAYQSQSIANFQFADGTVLTYTDLINKGFDLIGTSGDDVITGTNGVDRITGGAGNDVLVGGEGNDTYYYNLGDGVDTIVDNSGVNTVVFGAGINSTNTIIHVQNGIAQLRLLDANGVETAQGFDVALNADGTSPIDSFQFADGTAATLADLALTSKIWYGTSANDMITTGSDDDTVYAGAGNDTVYGNGGVDTLIGEAGYDTLYGGAGNDTFLINGTDSAYDTFSGGDGIDTILGGAGDDTIRVYNYSGANTVDVIDGGAGMNTIAGTSANDTINVSATTLFNIALIDGGAGNDTITGTSSNNTILGGAGYDSLSGGAGDDTFLINGTDSAYDTFNGGDGIDTILGGAGDDTIRLYNFSGSNTVEVIDGGAGVNVIAGTSANDTINVSATTVVNIALIDGGAGNDTITGTAGNDTILGGAGYDTLNGGAGNDTFLINGTDTAYDTFNGGDGIDTILGSTGDDTIRVYNYSGVNTVEVIDGGAGYNVIAGTSANDTINLSATTVVNIALIDGGAGNDTITGTTDNDTILGGSGYDSLSGGAGNDTFLINGTDSAYDTFNGGDGIDTILGGTGDDTIRLYNYSGVNTVEVIDGGAGMNTIAGTSANDTINVSTTTVVNIAMIDGGAGNDTITGTTDNDTILGGAGYDSLFGGTGNDTFLINGTDTAYDTFNGGDGIDTILGGTGDDTIRLYNYSGVNTVDVIDGGAGVNTIAGTSANDTINVSTTTVRNIAMIDGGAGNDTITGTTDNDTILGGSGYDSLSGGAGDDTFLINDTDSAYDTFNGGDGVDTILGGAGDDTIRLYNYSGVNTVEVIDGGAGMNTIAGTSANDTINVSATTLLHIARIDAGAGNDSVTGTSGDDTILGGAGYDSLSGGAGNDVLVGGSNNDTIYTGNGTDTVLFNRTDGWDTLTRDTSVSDTSGAIVQFGQDISALDLWFEQQGNDLAVHINGSTEGMTVQGWFNSPQLVSDIKAGNGADLAGTQVEQLITAMAQFSQSTGLTWSEAIQQRPDEVNQVLAASWQAA